MLIADVAPVETTTGGLHHALDAFMDELRACRAWLERSVAGDTATSFHDIGLEQVIRP
ncbi:MAG: hypothetical protein AAFT19_04415 [Pseudomonadota bacterium]